MDYIDASLKIISIFANLVVIATGLAAIYYVLELLFLKHRKRVTLERYLQNQSETSLRTQDGGARSVLHLMAKLKLTEAEVFDSAFSSHNIVCPDVASIDAGRTAEVQFQYIDRSASAVPTGATRPPYSYRAR